ncbi:MAG: hypothetical protein F4206_13370 [Gammaproteobacteria bacterium]|nr:hypothetical protein [Gammaproteobacteria bacterium]
MKIEHTTAQEHDGDTLGYDRVSTTDQDLAGQEDNFKKAGAIQIFTNVMPGGTSSQTGNHRQV